MKDIKEFKMHIHKLIDLNIIRNSTSRHRRLAFIVNNNGDHKREKSTMLLIKQQTIIPYTIQLQNYLIKMI